MYINIRGNWILEEMELDLRPERSDKAAEENAGSTASIVVA
jgi:hypothetical protein